ncbi:hypothetical protein PGT21_024038 [Puccinia graminis f. sp. tritici]|uniref:ACB domain-containing protein n=1 Tax=Puccinia graminis f. sp. tritici TaxID=56615 RepID=A0A5B0RK80_PUCGR|nr:hypothetical protein PGT21_024038 [Puccinia graminis f. sp. tritici]KAA1125702.1 hypothetical protein PGTUg99_001007 [Puccinia graminis f. sp. tritici]
MPTRTGGNPSGSRPLSSSSRLENFPKNGLGQPYTHKQQHSSSIGSSSTSLLAKSSVLPPSNPETSNESPPSNHSHDNSQSDHEEAFIEPLFQTALHIVQSSLPRSGQIQPTYNDKLLLYSLFKQAVHGDVKSTISKRPGVFDMLGRAKWDAWKAREGLSCSEAKRLYVESVLKILRSHRDRPEARLLIESLSGYESYLATVDHMSDSDEDLYSERKIEIPASMRGSIHTLSGQEQAQEGEEEEERSEENESAGSKSDDKSADQQEEEEEDIPTSGLGPYKSSSQLPDPINPSTETHILPPHSPRAIEPSSATSSESLSQSPSPKDDSSPAQASQESIQSNHIEPSEPRFTYAQVQRLVDQTPQTLPFHSLRSPLNHPTHSHPDLSRLTLPQSSHDPYSSSLALLQSNLEKLNQTIDLLHTLISSIHPPQHHSSTSSPPPPPSALNKNLLVATPSSSPSSNPHHKLHSLLSLSRLRTLLNHPWVKRLFLDLSLFFLLLKARKFFNKRPV